MAKGDPYILTRGMLLTRIKFFNKKAKRVGRWNSTYFKQPPYRHIMCPMCESKGKPLSQCICKVGQSVLSKQVGGKRILFHERCYMDSML